MAPPHGPGPGSDRALLLRAELDELLNEVEREVAATIGRPAPDVELLHDLHRDLRRLASGLKVWMLLVPSRHGGELTELNGRLRRLARRVGRVRDRDVSLTVLDPVVPSRGSPRDRAYWESVVTRLRDDAHTGRELLKALLRSEEQGGLFERVRTGFALRPPPGADRGLDRVLREERDLRHRKVRRAHRRARRKPSSERLHRLRIRIRQWRHLAALERATGVAASARPSAAWQRLQDGLGRVHDLDVALAALPRDLVQSPPAEKLRRDRRVLRTSLGEALEHLAPVRPTCVRAPPSSKRRG